MKILSDLIGNYKLTQMDIDKQFLSTLNYKVNEDGTVTSQFEEDSEKAIQNQLLEDYLTLLKLNGKLVSEGKLEMADYINSLKRSIDNDTKLVKGDDTSVLSKIEKIKKHTVEEPMQYGSLSVQVAIKNSFITGKNGIAPFALNNNSQILTQLYNVGFSLEYDGILNWLGMTSLGKYVDRDGNSILSWIGAMINAHVDVAKDPFVLRLNVNKYTWNLLNLLMRTGFGDDAFYFIGQPIMRQLAIESENSSGVVVDDPTMTVTDRQRENERQTILHAFNGWAHDKTMYSILDKLTDQNVLAKDRLNAISDDETKNIFKFLFGVSDEGYTANSVTPLEFLMTSDKVRINPDEGLTLENLSDKPMKEFTIPGTSRMLSPRDVQAYVFMAKIQLDVYAQAMADLVNGTKIDTKKQGINYTDQLEYRKKYNELCESKMFDYGLQRMLNKSFILTKTQLALDALPDILGTLMIQYSDLFLNIIGTTLNTINNHTEKSRNAVKRAVFGYIKQMAMNRVMADLNISFRPMVVGDNTMADRAIKIKARMIDNPSQFSEFVSGGKFTNQLLANLSRVAHQTPYGNEYYDLLGLNNSDVVEQSIKNQYIDDWMLLYESTDDEIKQFARDLAIYAFMTSADNQSFTTFFKYVPNQIRIDIGYERYMAEISNRFLHKDVQISEQPDDISSNFKISINDIIRCNWRDFNIVPVWNPNVFGKYGSYSRIIASQNLTYQDMGVDKDGNPIFEDKTTPKMFVANIRKKNGNYPPFIKLRRKNVSSSEVNPYILYEYIGEVQTNNPVYAITRQPGMEILAGSARYRFYENDRFDNYPSIFKHTVFDRMSEWFEEQVSSLVRYMLNNPSESGKYYLTQYTEAGLHPYDADEYDKSFVEEIGIIKRAAIIQIQKKDVKYEGNISYNQLDYDRNEAQSHPEILYVFTDNTDRDSGKNPVDDDSWYALKYGKGHHYPSMTQAVLRGLPNAFPISTQRWFHEGAKGDTGMWTDDAIEEFKTVVNAEFQDIIEAWNSGKYVTIRFANTDGLFGSKISKITAQRVPQIYAYLQQKVSELKAAVNGLSDESTTVELYTYSRYPEGKPNYEVSSEGDSRFSAMHAKFAEGTKLLGHDVGGRTIESVYQHGVKQGDWVTDNNNKTGAPKDKTIIKGDTEEDSYTQGYLPLWREWARQNPQLIEELRRNAAGKVLTDKFASTKVSQARALADILNQTANVEDRPLPKFNGISEEDVREAIHLIRNRLEHAEGVVDQILYNSRYRGMSEQDRQDLYKYQQIVDECTLLLDGLYNGSSEVIINEYHVPQVVLKQSTQPSPQRPNVESLSQAQQALGRISITPSNKQYITEKIELRIGDKLYSQRELEQFLSIQNQIVDILFGNTVTDSTKNYVRVAYSEWKRLLEGNGDNAIGVYVERELEDTLNDGDLIDTNDENFLKYDKNTKTITIPKIEYELVRVLSKNPAYVEFLNKINPVCYSADMMAIERTKYKDVGEMVALLASNIFEEGSKKEFDVDDLREVLDEYDIHIKYSYTDSRQLTLWNDSDEYPEDYMKNC